jgi:hypothetical protein
LNAPSLPGTDEFIRRDEKRMSFSGVPHPFRRMLPAPTVGAIFRNSRLFII